MNNYLLCILERAQLYPKVLVLQLLGTTTGSRPAFIFAHDMNRSLDSILVSSKYVSLRTIEACGTRKSVLVHHKVHELNRITITSSNPCGILDNGFQQSEASVLVGLETPF